ncbi:ERV1 Mitochondrial sulfhydryl oxidase [Pyrenophora tritici-repentis]|uniref:Sulfhydryl oxidase n=2 Tax=Pyrenophora tritici-repentis TaxID=45151 RepID=A0A2W1DJM3_9PLEO|nr:mitochondrial FAD-linked sulfhydryl oxidase ERV1 [Pyrenophora tritici-repentis Pt-1C-BFP]KAA8627090.1 Sulfhydryl oxidase [Pyrenophora tritici-repentis]EDU44629.1 mitochondrial FAD-linked sulfhydryl oxidase ERV1 [Pyrenophora tritici-repentis Pt-1C-BFP]KAF7455522.1 Sulfhydryl oxidase [Pyrenophora tritici-repentis]KAF7578726.1 ERV1, Mitochondrial sulfhydryl oxidase protein [Pyrenophora tritici-repentis]KAG9389273.1 Sulfhydryl oxidase [Pyrenophora tritici-repentis]
MAQSSTETSEKQETDRTGYTKLANGIVLGPDGKPCRTCNDVKSLFAMSGKLPTKRTQSQPTTTTAAAPTLPADCPPDVEELGRSSWTLLHSITGAYPVNPSPQLQSETKSFLTTFGKLYPCWVCAEDFQAWMQKNTPRVSSRSEFGEWMCEAHNAVNEKLGKQTFDCKRWEERWRTGWKDGRCDF